MGLGFSSGRRFREGDLVAERGEPLRVVAGEALGIPVVEVVAAEFAVRLAVAQHVVGDDEEAVGDGDDGLLVPAALDQAAVLGGEVGVVFEDGTASTLHEGLAQDAAGKAGTATQAFASTLVSAGAEAGPGRRMARGEGRIPPSCTLSAPDLDDLPMTMSHYAATKFALEAVSDSLRRELAPLGVRERLVRRSSPLSCTPPAG